MTQSKPCNMTELSETDFERDAEKMPAGVRGVPTCYCVVKETGQLRVWPPIAEDQNLQFMWVHR